MFALLADKYFRLKKKKVVSANSTLPGTDNLPNFF